MSAHLLAQLGHRARIARHVSIQRRARLCRHVRQQGGLQRVPARVLRPRHVQHLKLTHAGGLRAGGQHRGGARRTP